MGSWLYLQSLLALTRGLPNLQENSGMRWGWLVGMFSIAFAIAGLVALSTRVDLSAVQQPGRTGEYLRSKLVRALIRRRAARENIPPGPPDRETSMSLSAGRSIYEAHCADCHGLDGSTPTPVGSGMLPRTPSLNSAGVQSYSDRELFSIIREGVRFTGMPGFAGAEGNDQIWYVVDYVRSLR
jgi:mono/diheme cytochrome c family protein